jgi:hypothetical protein
MIAMAAYETIIDGCQWPGIAAFESASYTCSHGVTPGVISAVSRIPPTEAANLANFRFSDGNRVIELLDCKLHTVEATAGAQGPIYTYRILDRRWKWQFGEISGHYNQRDRRDNLIPWMCKSPKELAELCLKAMGETAETIDLPEGLSQADLNIYRDNPAPGEKTPITRTNPEINWDALRPAVALDRLCSHFGRRLIFDYATNTVLIQKPGYGSVLPFLPHTDEIRAHLNKPVKPKGIGIIGAPVRNQMRLKLVPVGEEWDGRFLPLDELSYAPANFVKQAGEWKVTFTGVAPYECRLAIGESEFTASGATAAEAATALADQIDGWILINPSISNPKHNETVVAVAAGSSVTITFEARLVEPEEGEEPEEPPPLNTPGFMPDIRRVSGNIAVVLKKIPMTSPWQMVNPEQMFNVVATERLTYQRARELAERSVYRCFRIVNEDVTCGWADDRKLKRIFVPRYGEIDRRQQLILESTLPEQIQPTAREDDRVGRTKSDSIFLTATPDYYDGYSRDRQPQVFGQVANICNGDMFLGNRRLNTPPNRRLAAGFSIDPENQLVIFSRPQYFCTRSGGYLRFDPPRLTLEASVLVKDNETHAPIRYRRWFHLDEQSVAPNDPDSPPPEDDGDGPKATTVTVKVAEYALGNGLPEEFELKNVKDNADYLPDGLYVDGPQSPNYGIEWYRHDDVPYCVLSFYDYNESQDKYTFAESLNEAGDASRPRADYYLGAHVLEHLVKEGQSASYIGVHAVPLDGAVQQVSIEVGSGAKTTASRNAEHSVWVPALPQRRRDEGLAANEKAARQNLAESRGGVESREMQRRIAALSRQS